MTTKDNDTRIGQHHLYRVTDLYHATKRLRTDILSEEYFLYRWWFPEDSPIMDYLRDYTAKHPEDFDMKYVLDKLKKKVLDSTTYYALYLGKSTNGRKRFADHTRGDVKQSSLRKTLHAILSLAGESCNEKDISNVLRQCYYEWMEFFEEDHNLLDSFEMMAIVIGHYPLNLDGNPSISEGWKSAIENMRKELND